MGPFEMVVAIIAIVCVTRMIRYAIQQRVALRERQLGGVSKDLEDRLQRMEQRMANLETIVLEREKKGEFERALK
jgi:hypothetical protein